MKLLAGFLNACCGTCLVGIMDGRYPWSSLKHKIHGKRDILLLVGRGIHTYIHMTFLSISYEVKDILSINLSCLSIV